MAYPFVKSATDLGRTSGPRLAIAWHFAEGGGTVGYLAKTNPNGVSVHFVVEYSGRIVQMLDLTHLHSSLRVSAIRGSDDPPYDWNGTPVAYGATAAKVVLGDWWKNPNNASIGVEVEGFAKAGPNVKQTQAITALWVDMATRFPGIRSLGHRDFADYKGCPGKLFPWNYVGGHGPGEADPSMVKFTPGIDVAGTVTVKADTAVIPIVGGTRVPIKAGIARPALGIFTLDDLADRPCYLMGVGADLAFIAVADVDFTANPTGDCADEVTAAVAADRAKARVVWP